VKVIVFDLDDTLLPWQGPIREAVGRAAAGSSPPVAPAALGEAIFRTWFEQAADAWTGRATSAAIEEKAAAAIAAGCGLDTAAAGRLYDVYIRHLSDLIAPYEDTRILSRLKRRYRLGVATNGTGDAQRRKLRKIGPADLFDFVVVSAEVGVAKPDRAFYEVVLRAAGVPAADIVVVGDHVARDLLPAAALGMRAIWLRRDPQAHPDAPWTGPAISSLEELPALLEAAG
jgi:putative hydrolase of the HAD superfamily